MKRYIYILVSIAMSITYMACEILPTSVVIFNYGMIYSESQSKSATIYGEDISIIVDGVKVKDINPELGYRVAEDEGASLTIVSTYRTEGNTYIFDIDNLTPSTEYVAYILLDGGTYGSGQSMPYYFTTEEHIPTYSITMNSAVQAKGLYAHIALSDVAYLADDQRVDIGSVLLEYRASRDSSTWTEIAIDGSMFSDGKEIVKIPADGYLEENFDYIYRATVVPADSSMPTLMGEEATFKTDYADVTADISRPILRIEDDMLHVIVEDVRVYFDDIYIPDYLYLEYGFKYRKVDDAEWSSTIDAEYADGSMSISIALDNFEEGATYEFCAHVVAGANGKTRTSDIASIDIPKSDIPTPPVGGDADTTDIAGTWHLTLWRDTLPTFDIYMSITENGVVTLWQRMTTREWELYYSTATFDNGIISGIYSDGTAWSTSYSVSVSEDSMTWTATDDATDISVYTRATLPEDLPTVEHETTRSTARFL